MTATTTIVDTYIAAWNELDQGRRRALVAETFTEDASYLDPLMSGEGHDGIDAMIASVHAQYPGHRFELAEGPDSHHDRLRFAWHLIGPGGGPIAKGIDFAVVADDGRMRFVTGFLEQA
jgi:hypothetical protein